MASRTEQQITSAISSSKPASSDEREIGGQAVWSLSTAKPGNGVEQLRDDNTDTYWQCAPRPLRTPHPAPRGARAPRASPTPRAPARSDGPQPHLINIQFAKKMRVHEICIYTDFKLDESYTPSKISIRMGSTFHDLQEVHVEELNEPSGWVTILPPPPEDAEEPASAAARPLCTHFIQVAILANHQNGRDTHIRQIKIYTPRRHLGQHMGLPEFSTTAFRSYA